MTPIHFCIHVKFHNQYILGPSLLAAKSKITVGKTVHGMKKNKFI